MHSPLPLYRSVSSTGVGPPSPLDAGSERILCVHERERTIANSIFCSANLARRLAAGKDVKVG